MRRKPEYYKSRNEGRDRWLVSYTDIITILLILFVAAAAQGLPHPESTPKKIVAPAKTVPIPVSAPAKQGALVDVQARLAAQGLDLHREERGLVVSLPQAILFPSGEDRVIAAALPMISEIASVLRDIPNQVTLVGHADAIPIHNKRFRSNWELSAARSLSLLKLLTSDYGISESRLSVSSYGANRAKGPNDTPDGRAENRRVEILILDEVSPATL